MTSKFSNLLGLIIPSAHKDDSFGFLGASSPVGEARSLPLKLSPLHMLGERICMHKVGAEVLNGDFSVCHSLRHPKMTNIDMANLSDPGPPRFIKAMQLRLSW